jgi:hypothetical protein
MPLSLSERMKQRTKERAELSKYIMPRDLQKPDSKPNIPMPTVSTSATASSYQRAIHNSLMEQMYNLVTFEEKATLPQVAHLYVDARGVEIKQETQTKQDCDTMYISEHTPIEVQQRQRLAERLYTVYREKTADLRRLYGLDDDVLPRTANEFIQRIKDGKFVIREDRGDKDTSSPTQYISFRDPAKKRDELGYNAAAKKLDEALASAKDEIMILPVEQGLKTLQGFQAKVFN